MTSSPRNHETDQARESHEFHGLARIHAGQSWGGHGPEQFDAACTLLAKSNSWKFVLFVSLGFEALTMKRGSVVWVNLSDASPPEMGKVRPGIVVSGTAHNEVLNTVVVVPTSSIAPEIWPLRLAVGNFAGKDTYAVIPGIRQVRKGRLRGTLGQLSPQHLSALDECLDAYLR